MSRDRQIAVLASILGLAGLIIGIVAISQDSGAEDEWIRNRALPGAASSEEAVLQKQFAVQEVADLTERVAEIERLDTLTEQASTEADEKSDTTNVAVQGMTNEVADLTERVAELEKTPLPAGPEEVMPTVEIPTEEVDYADEELDQTPLPADESGVTVELTEELLTPPPTTTEPESLEPIADVLDSSAGTGEEGDESDSDGIPTETFGKPAYIYHRELVVLIENQGIIWKSKKQDNCPWYTALVICGFVDYTGMIGDYEETVPKIYSDKYLIVFLSCPNMVRIDAPAVIIPDIVLSRTGSANDYWLAPTRASTHWAGWQFEFNNFIDAPGKPWASGTYKQLVNWRWDSFLENQDGIATIRTNDITIIIRDNETEEFHYVYLKASLSYMPLEGSKARCSADLTFIRSYP